MTDVGDQAETNLPVKSVARCCIVLRTASSLLIGQHIPHEAQGGHRAIGASAAGEAERWTHFR